LPKTLLMLATFGFEIVEVGGTLALHAQAGDVVHAAVLLSRPEARPQIEHAARILGVQSVRFLDFAYGEVQPDVASKIKLVRLFREIRPDILILQDPEHAQHDFDPDRRLASLLYLEALAVTNRDWKILECGGYAPHTIADVYYMTPEHPNCVVEIGSVFAIKQQALRASEYQLAFSAQMLRERLGDEVLRHIVADYDARRDDNLELGLALHTEMEKARAMNYGVLSHSNAGLAEAFRHEGPLKLARL